jgi:hypothetical protein
VRSKSRNASFVDHDTLSFFRCVSLLVLATRLKFAVMLEWTVMHLLLLKGVKRCLLCACITTKCKFYRSLHFFLFPLHLSTCATYKAHVCCQVRVQTRCIFYYLKELHTGCSVRAKSRNASFVDLDTLSFFRCVSLLVQATRLKFAVMLESKVMHLLLPKGFAHYLLCAC